MEDKDQVISRVKEFCERWGSMIPQNQEDYYSDSAMEERSLFRQRQQMIDELQEIAFSLEPLEV